MDPMWVSFLHPHRRLRMTNSYSFFICDRVSSDAQNDDDNARDFLN